MTFFGELVTLLKLNYFLLPSPSSTRFSLHLFAAFWEWRVRLCSWLTRASVVTHVVKLTLSPRSDLRQRSIHQCRNFFWLWRFSEFPFLLFLNSTQRFFESPYYLFWILLLYVWLVGWNELELGGLHIKTKFCALYAHIYAMQGVNCLLTWWCKNESSFWVKFPNCS